MITQPTEYTQPTISDQASVYRALFTLARQFPTLPAVSPSVHAGIPDRIYLLVSASFDAFEQWRTALGIAPSAVRISATKEHACLVAEGTIAAGGVKVELQGPSFTPPAVMPLQVRGDERSAAAVTA